MATLLHQLLSVTSPEICPPSNSTTPMPPLLSSSSKHSRPVSILDLLVSIVTLAISNDWVKLAIFGGIVEVARRMMSLLYLKIWDSIFINVYFQQEDPSYEWMMVWLSKQPNWSEARDLEISTNPYGSSGATFMLGGHNDLNNSKKPIRKLAYLPSLSRQYTLWYKRHLVQVIRTQAQTGFQGSKEQTLYLSIMSRTNQVLTEILEEARQMYAASQENSVCVYVSDSNNNWRHVSCRPKRSLCSVILEPGIKDTLLDDASDFLASKNWYAERGIPFRRGYLLYGAPGSGKTSVIHSLAGELGLDVYIISLSRSGLDDSALSELLNDLPERCVALMEDIDAAFTPSIGNRDQHSSPTFNTVLLPSPQVGQPNFGRTDGAQQSQSRLSLSGLLNALDGVGAQEGRILFATTNHFDKLDPALCRPGRMDWHIEFKLASAYQAGELFKRFYLPSDVGSIPTNDATTSAEGLMRTSELTTEESQAPTMIMGLKNKHRAPKISKQKLDQLSREFSAKILDRTMSMAALQGYLMTYKTRPVQAVEDVASWVEKEISKMDEKTLKA